MSAVKAASEASRAEQANERMDEQVAQCLHLGSRWIWPTVNIQIDNLFEILEADVSGAVAVEMLEQLHHFKFGFILEHFPNL